MISTGSPVSFRRAVSPVTSTVLGQVIDGATARVLRLEDLVRHHALREERVERLDGRGGQVPAGVHRAGEEAGIEEVQDRVLHAADVLVDVHPVGGVLGRGRRRGAGRGEAGEVPRRIHEGVHRVRLAPGGLAAFRAGHVAPCRVAVERVSGLVEADVIGKRDGQVLLPLRHHAAVLAVDDRDRAAPVALARQAPVAQAELGDALPHAVCLAEGDGGVDGLLARRDLGPGEGLGPRTFSVLGGTKAAVRHRMAAVERHEGVDHRQVVLAREVEVALVMGRAAEDRAGAVVHQDEVGDVDRQLPVVVEGVADAQARVEAALLGLLDLLLGRAEMLALLDEGGEPSDRAAPPPSPADGRARCPRTTRPSACRGGSCRPRPGRGPRGRRSARTRTGARASGRSSCAASASPSRANGRARRWHPAGRPRNRRCERTTG
jgi:hypothetical protein